MEEIEDEFRKGRVKERLNELWALLGAVNASIERGRGGMGEWAFVDDEALRSWGRLRRWGSFFPFLFVFLRLIEVVAF